jgi:hypothetical protein
MMMMTFAVVDGIVLLWLMLLLLMIIVWHRDVV